MRLRIIPAVILLLVSPDMFSQSSDNYIVARAPFSSSKADDFSPVLYKRSIVFCSNRGRSRIAGYSTTGKLGFFKIYYVDTTDLNRGAMIMPGSINSPLNNGPVTFSRNGDTIYFSRNLIVDGTFKAITGNENKLGLFYAVLKNGEWTDVTEMRFNDYSWNVTTPCISPDGRRLYFASDRPEGLGGSDLYYSEWKKGYWNNPVNLGKPINTGGNEAYPFVNESGELFFSSDSLPGKGGKDIFFTKYSDSAWIKPVALGAPVNSKADDFGFYTDNLLSRGYFSSNRGGMLDIYSFKTVYPQFLFCEEQKKPESCFSFSDDSIIEFDARQLQLSWSFGDGITANGASAGHCYKNPGRYEVRENIADRRTGKGVMNKMILSVNVRGYDKPYIESPEFAVMNSPVSFTARASSDKQIMAAFWDFGASGQEKGLNVSRSFAGSGEMHVNMLVTLKDPGTGKFSRECVSRVVRVLEKSIGMQGMESKISSYRTISGNSAHSELKYSAGKDLSGKGVFRVQVLTSEKKIAAEDRMFSNLKPYYPVSVFEIPGENRYAYIIDEQLSFDDAYQEYLRAVSLGFRDALITTYVPSGAAMEIWNFKRAYGVSSDRYFMNKGYSLSPSVVPVLDELVMILRRNQGLKLLVTAHTDIPDQARAQALTQKQAQGIVDYLADAGISRSRLSAAGYGSSRPLGQDQEDARNRRIDFTPLQEQ